ncbi:hypothetical protein GGX14DRAFT_406998 [Mycena pura]|uniref:Uncharacterized protein n=1 Tax=Mycena pura TaxID=153505 RepID=A0AAD6USW7_9AGAR|nr:hypothetical protein GGX14DRAFT_406998 [Mycena pura]
MQTNYAKSYTYEHGGARKRTAARGTRNVRAQSGCHPPTRAPNIPGPPPGPPQPPRLWIHGEWYKDTTLNRASGWTTDWDDWELLEDFFVATVDGEPRIQSLFRECWGIQGTIHPMAYNYRTCGLDFLFSAGGRYYFWSDSLLLVWHSKDFASPKEFLDYALLDLRYQRTPDVAVPLLPGANLDWMRGLGQRRYPKDDRAPHIPGHPPGVDEWIWCQQHPPQYVIGPHPPPRLWIHGEWYNDTTLDRASGWTTDWDEWELIEDFFVATVDGEPRIQSLFRECWGIQDTIHPVAYTYGTCGLYFLFSAGGRYYFWSDGLLLVHSKDFASPKEFLDYALSDLRHQRTPDMEVPLLPGANLDWVGELGQRRY